MLKYYVDMDGTITDFAGAVEALGPEAAEGLSYGTTKEQKDTMFKAIEKAGPEFWSQMAWAPDGQILWNFVKNLNPVLLSSPGEDGLFRTYAELGKRIWVQDHMPGTPLFLEPDKFRYAERDAVLIDDMKDNVGAWIQCGGIGIQHTNAVSTIEKIKQLIDSPNPQPMDVMSIASHIRRIAALFIPTCVGNTSGSRSRFLVALQSGQRRTGPVSAGRGFGLCRTRA